MFEVLHWSENIKHGWLLHPITKREELCRNCIELVDFFTWCSFFRAYMYHSLSWDCEILVSKLFFINYNIQIIGSEKLRGDRRTIAVEELNWSSISMLSKETNSLLSRLNLYKHVIDRSSLANEICLSCKRGLILAFIFIVLNDLAEVLEIDRTVLLLLFLFFIHIFALLFFHFGLFNRKNKLRLKLNLNSSK